jgi:hypothetical protein
MRIAQQICGMASALASFPTDPSRPKSVAKISVVSGIGVDR